MGVLYFLREKYCAPVTVHCIKVPFGFRDSWIGFQVQSFLSSVWKYFCTIGLKKPLYSSVRNALKSGTQVFSDHIGWIETAFSVKEMSTEENGICVDGSVALPIP